MASAVAEVQTEAEFNSTLSSNEVVAVQFFASWNSLCKTTALQVAQLADKFKTEESVKFICCDVDEVGEVAETWGINCLPTFCVFECGQLATRIEGADLERFEAAVTTALSGTAENPLRPPSAEQQQQQGDEDDE